MPMVNGEHMKLPIYLLKYIKSYFEKCWRFGNLMFLI